MFKAESETTKRSSEAFRLLTTFSKKILVAGSSVPVGTQLVAFLDTGGHEVWRLVEGL